MWLANKTNIKYCSKDRSKTYNAAIKDTLPKVQHITDRFHLIHNIGQVIIDFLKNNYTNGIILKQFKTEEDKKEISDYVIKLKKEQEARLNKKWQLIMQVQEMYKAIPNISHVCRSFSLNCRTILKYLGF